MDTWNFVIGPSRPTLHFSWPSSGSLEAHLYGGRQWFVFPLVADAVWPMGITGDPEGGRCWLRPPGPCEMAFSRHSLN